MKRYAIVALCAIVCLPLAAQAKPVSAADAGYALGLLMGADVKGTGVDLSVDEFIAGFKAALSGGQARMSQAQAQAAFQSAYQAAKGKQAETKLAEGKAFLATNGKKAGVKTTASGLQYEVLRDGSGPKPAATDTVTVNYEGKLLDGTVFDSSYARKQPATFALNGVIKGWTEGLQLMPTGSKFRFCIPSGLAYGEQGAGDDIGPNETLMFDVELISIKGK